MSTVRSPRPRRGRWSRRDSVLVAHAGHAATVLDERSVRCDTCQQVLLLDSNRAVPVGQSHVQALPAAPRPRDAQRRLPCLRCGRLLKPEPDGRLPLHALPGVSAEPCQATDAPAALPPGGWRELVADQAAAASPPTTSLDGSVDAEATAAKHAPKGGSSEPPGAPAPPSSPTSTPAPWRPCCVCPPVACATDDTGDACIDAACGVCLHGCPAGLAGCCLDQPDTPTTPDERTGP